MDPQSASATSLNFRGFEEMKGFGTPSLLYGQIFIEPPSQRNGGQGSDRRPPPGQVPYLRARRATWSKSRVARDLERQGFLLPLRLLIEHRVHGTAFPEYLVKNAVVA